MTPEEKKDANAWHCIFLNSLDMHTYHVSFNFGSGYGDRLVAENNHIHWIGSGSTNILINIKKNKIKAAFKDIEVQTMAAMDTATIAVSIKADEYHDVIGALLDIVFSEEVLEGEFEFQRAASLQDFDQHMKNMEFRSMMEIQEFALPNRLYQVSLIQADLTQVKYHDIVLLNRTLFASNNAVIVITGNIRPDVKRLVREKDIPNVNHQISHVYRNTRNNGKDQRLVKSNAGINHSVGSLLLRNKPSRFSIEIEEVYLQIIGHALFEENYYICAAKDMASIIYKGNDQTNVKSKLLAAIWSERKFDSFRNKAKSKLQDVMKNDAVIFSIMAGQYAVQDKSFIKIMQLTNEAGFEGFLRYIQEIKQHMTETKIIYSAGG